MDEITEKSLVPKGLADAICREILPLLGGKFEEEKAVRLGITLGFLKWGKKNADKSGG